MLAGGLLTSCSLLPAASPRHEGTASSQAPQYYSDAWLSDDSLHYVYSYAGNGGGTGTDTKKPVAVSGNGKKGNLPQTGDDADGAVATVALAGGALVVAGIAARKRLSANGK